MIKPLPRDNSVSNNSKKEIDTNLLSILMEEFNITGEISKLEDCIKQLRVEIEATSLARQKMIDEQERIKERLLKIEIKTKNIDRSKEYLNQQRHSINGQICDYSTKCCQVCSDIKLKENELETNEKQLSHVKSKKKYQKLREILEEKVKRIDFDIKILEEKHKSLEIQINKLRSPLKDIQRNVLFILNLADQGRNSRLFKNNK